MKKRWVLLSVMCILLFGVFGTGAIGAEGADEAITAEESSSYPPRSEWTDAKFFEFDASTGTIVKYSLDGPKDVVIPAEINGVAVRHIGEEAFYKWDYSLRNIYEIQSVKFPEGLTSIGEFAFYGNQLTRVSFPQGLTSIGDGAFSGNQLTQVSFPQGLTSIGGRAFGWNQLTQVSFPQGLTSIGDWAFYNNQLTQVSFPQGLTSIGAFAFGDNKLTQVSFPQGLISIGAFAFGDNKLTQVQFPNSLQMIGRGAFYSNKLTEVSIPEGCDVASGTFDSGVKVHRPGGVSSRLFAFDASTGTILMYSANGPKDVVIPAEIHGVVVRHIGEYAFSDNQLTQVSFPKGLTSIGDYAFSSNKLTQVNFPQGLTSIGDSAFSSNQLTQVHFPDSLTSIGDAAFSSNQLTQVHFPDSLTSIGSYAFYNNQLTQVKFPESLERIEEKAFRENQLTEVEVPKNCEVHPEAFDEGVKVNRRGMATVARFFRFDASTGTITKYSPDGPKDVVIPSQINGIAVRHIGAYAFYHPNEEKDIQSVKFPKGLESIGNGAFHHNRLKELTLPEGLTKLGEEAFEHNRLTKIEVPGSLKAIGKRTFCWNQLRELKLPEGLEGIGKDAFSVNDLQQVVFPESLKNIDEDAFSSNSLKEVEVPENCNYHPHAFDKGVKIYPRKKGTRYVSLKTPSGTIDVPWREGLFKQTNADYHNDIALVSAALSDAAETIGGDEIVQAYKDLGFQDKNIFLYSYPDNPKNRSDLDWATDDVLAFSIAHREFDDEVLLTICLRGTKSDGDIDKDKNVGAVGSDFFGVRVHNGFYEFYQDVFKRGMVDYVKAHPEIIEAREKKKLKFLVTGHSLGAAGANLLGVSLNREESGWSDKNNIFVYTFATPNVYKRGIGGNNDLESQWNGNIFNIINVKDNVPRLPMKVFNEWKKFGRKLKFNFVNSSYSISPITEQHNMEHYIRAVQENAKSNVWEEGRGGVYMIHCPVDVEMIDETGKVVARVVNNQIDETVTSVATYVEEDQKYFYLYEPEKYTVRVIGNDTGTMDMFVGMEDLESEEEIGRSEFKNVEIVKGKTMEGTVSKDSAPTEAPVKLYTLDKNGVPMKEIQSDGKEVENLFAEKVISDPKYSWTVTFNGELDASTVKAENFFIQDEDGNLLSGIQPTVVEGTKVRFVNNTTFEKNKVYYLVVKKEVRGQGNTKLKKTVILKFRVE